MEAGESLLLRVGELVGLDHVPLQLNAVLLVGDDVPLREGGFASWPLPRALRGEYRSGSMGANRSPLSGFCCLSRPPSALLGLAALALGTALI
jgi:hypothetical protein